MQRELRSGERFERGHVSERLDPERAPRHRLRTKDVVDVAVLPIPLQVLCGKHPRRDLIAGVAPHATLLGGDSLFANEPVVSQRRGRQREDGIGAARRAIRISRPRGEEQRRTGGDDPEMKRSQFGDPTNGNVVVVFFAA
jgi:hypothetical protein